LQNAFLSSVDLGSDFGGESVLLWPQAENRKTEVNPKRSEPKVSPPKWKQI